MHELALAENLKQIIEEQAVRQGFSRVHKVVVAVGALSCVEPCALEFCFAAVMGGSLAEEANLEIVPIPGRGRCPKCQKEQVLQELYDLCLDCQAPLDVVAGLEIRLQELLVE
ncbi:MAG: hydrogenase maturation nickel metallochaperone HypA [Methylohalobius sp.]